MKISSSFLYTLSFLLMSTACTHANNKSHDALRHTELGAITDFINNEISRPEYPSEVLPNDFTHLIQLIGYGHTLQNDRIMYGRSTFNIFNKLVGGAPFVNPYPFATMLENLPRLLKPYVVTFKSTSGHTGVIVDADMFGRLKQTVDDMLFLEFGSRFELFKSDPALFFNNLSEQIIQAAREEVEVERFRQSMVRFIEIGISKMIWDITDSKSIWPNVKKISTSIEELYNTGIIHDINDIDNLCWSLVHRFNYFLDITFERMPESFYHDMKTDIHNEPPLFLRLEEQDICLQNKFDCFKHALLKNEAKSLAYNFQSIVPS